MSDFQTILIGAGVAAATVARTLLAQEPNHRLLVLDAGPSNVLKDRRLWWDYAISGRAAYEHCHDLPLPDTKASKPGKRTLKGPGQQPAMPSGVAPTRPPWETENASVGGDLWVMQSSRVMGFGGSTTHWGGWALRFRPEDFHLFEHTKKGADWPITYDDLAPYYDLAEELLSVAGSNDDEWTPRYGQNYPLPAFGFTAADGPMIDAFKSLDIKYGTMPVARYRKCMTTGTCKYCPLGARFAAGYIFDELEESGRHPGLEYRTRSPVIKLLHDRKDRIAGVRYLDGSTGQERDVRADRFVVCSGAIESPKLLLRSQSPSWPLGLGNETGREFVGKNLISHTLIYAKGRSTGNPNRFQQELDFPVLMSRHYDTQEHQADGKLFLFRDRTLPGFDLAGMMARGMSRKEIDAVVRGPAEWSLQGFMEEFANPRNSVAIGDGLNRLGLPQSRISFTRADGFAEASKVRLGWISEIIKAMGLSLIEAKVTDVRGDHAASTCRMAREPGGGVVDPDLAVFGVDNLYVCSNAVFPSGAAVNPTLTLTALSIRLGMHLLGKPPLKHHEPKLATVAAETHL